MKVYLATAGEYSDDRVAHAFTRREDAESYALGDDVMELDVHDGPIEVRTWHTLLWWPDSPDREGDGNRLENPHAYTSRRDFDGRPGHVQHKWFTESQFQPVRRRLLVEGWDLERVRKTYSEQRAQYLSQPASPPVR